MKDEDDSRWVDDVMKEMTCNDDGEENLNKNSDRDRATLLDNGVLVGRFVAKKIKGIMIV